MPINTKTFTTYVTDQVTSIQARSSQLVNFTIGSVLRALVETNAAIALWFQGMIMALLATTRAATSNSSDLDTWMADFGLTRLPAVAASGNVTFARFTTTMQAVIPIGAVVQTADGSQLFTVVVDVSNSAYIAKLGGYVIGAGINNVSVPVIANVPGYSGNVLANTITSLTQSITFVDTVTNTLQFTTGADAENDETLRARFVDYIASLSKATKSAVGYAATSLKQGLTYRLVENQRYDGTAQNGYFYLVVDDGTGYPSSTFLATVYNAVDAVRPFTSTFGVFAPVVVTANVSMTITTTAGYDHIGITATVITELNNYINSLPLGAILTNSRLAQVAYDASPGVINVTGIAINGSATDLTCTSVQIIKVGTVTVN